MTKTSKSYTDGTPIRILVLDDEESIRWVIEKTLVNFGYELHFAGSAEEATELMRHQPIDMALVDLHLPGEDGWTFLQNQQEHYPDLLVAIITAQSTMHNAVTSMKLGAFDYLIKPFDIEEVEALVERAAQAIRIARHHAPASDLPPASAESSPEETFVGKSRSVREIYKSIGLVADTDLTVLILGESGTGKELVARAIHHHSKQADRPFVAVNCAAIPRDLLESELFGHERGAFTGANERKLGRIEQAQGGTLFLDEIGELPLELQAKLLRVLQELEYQRVGGTHTLRVRARILAATNQELAAQVAQGQFRGDLYYRISAFTITCTPLRERREDIPALLEHFLHREGHDLGLPRRGLTPEAVQALTEHDWPGNVRELENVVKSLMITAPSHMVGLAELPRNLINRKEEVHPAGDFEQVVLHTWRGAIDAGMAAGQGQLLPEAVACTERPLIRQVLLQTGWNQVQASRILGINRNTLRTKLQSLRIETPTHRRGQRPKSATS